MLMLHSFRVRRIKNCLAAVAGAFIDNSSLSYGRWSASGHQINAGSSTTQGLMAIRTVDDPDAGRIYPRVAVAASWCFHLGFRELDGIRRYWTRPDYPRQTSRPKLPKQILKSDPTHDVFQEIIHQGRDEDGIGHARSCQP